MGLADLDQDIGRADPWGGGGGSALLTFPAMAASFFTAGVLTFPGLGYIFTLFSCDSAWTGLCVLSIYETQECFFFLFINYLWSPIGLFILNLLCLCMCLRACYSFKKGYLGHRDSSVGEILGDNLTSTVGAHMVEGMCVHSHTCPSTHM